MDGITDAMDMSLSSVQLSSVTQSCTTLLPQTPTPKTY